MRRNALRPGEIDIRMMSQSEHGYPATDNMAMLRALQKWERARGLQHPGASWYARKREKREREKFAKQ